MSNFFKLNDNDRKTVILQTGIKKNNLFPQVVEKDLWVTTILQIVFSLPFANRLICKGLCVATPKPLQVISDWQLDYEKMQTMIYGEFLPFDKLLKRIEELQERFRSL
ncbi:MAG: hypothetical protein LBQ31_06385 [Bacteroidales bacterium]|jgi:uncharacterized protein (DUF1919 family)|nr:hypothetical protein [Bacteroidales bacterium]